ncbi:MAG: CBS domain-containing protein [Desulfovibrionaceae bacterium]|nr:CBS domain-containing protein [Desulfovibrionaceae bacterium]
MARKIKDMMVKVSNLSSIDSRATLAEAMLALGKAMENRDEQPLSTVLVVKDEQGRMVGKLSTADMLRIMEGVSSPVDVNASAQLERVGYVIESCTEQMRQASRPWDNLGALSSQKKVLDIMQKPGKGQVISQDESPNEAIHRFVSGGYNNLFVSDSQNNLVGVLNKSSFCSEVVSKLHRAASAA